MSFIDRVFLILLFISFCFIVFGIINLNFLNIHFQFIAIGLGMFALLFSKTIVLGFAEVIFGEDTRQPYNNITSNVKPEPHPLTGVPNLGKGPMLCPKCRLGVQRKCSNCGLFSCSSCYGNTCPVCTVGILEIYTKRT